MIPDAVLIAHSSSQDSARDAAATMASPGSVATHRRQFVLVQALVMIFLSFQILFSPNSLLAFETQELVVLGLMAATACSMFLPLRMWESPWLIGSVVLFDTAVTTYIFYLSGNTGSDLYMVYFLILLIAAFASTLKQMIGLSLILCAAYGGNLFLMTGYTGAELMGHLLRIPVLLILATFYGVTVETVRKERIRGTGLLDTIFALRRSEEERERLIHELQEALANIKTLSGMLPICASCKKIRDDKGFWNQIETYIKAHSDAKFTHGICPECADKLYKPINIIGELSSSSR
jgi:hypothetical protein